MGIIDTGGSGGGVVVNDGGIIQPGNSTNLVAMLTIQGPLTLDSGSTTVIGLRPTESSKIFVNGLATLNGTLKILAPESVFKGSKYEVLRSTGGIVGNFSPQVFCPQGIHFVATYENNVVYVSVPSTGLVPPVLMSLVGLSSSEITLANYLNANQDLVLDAFGLLLQLSQGDLARALDKISPLSTASDPFVTHNASFTFSALVRSQCADRRHAGRRHHELVVAARNGLPSEELLTAEEGEGVHHRPLATRCQNNAVWGLGFGDVSHQGAGQEMPSFNYWDGGCIVGGDHESSDGIIGAALAYDRASIHRHESLGHAEVDVGSVALYGNIDLGRTFLEGTLWEALTTPTMSGASFSPDSRGRLRAPITATRGTYMWL